MGICVLMVLHIIALRLGWSRELHVLKIEAHRLREEYTRRLAMMRENNEDDGLPPIEVGSIEDDEEPIQRHAA